MRIGIDARAIGWAGLGRYARNLLAQYVRTPSDNEFVVFTPQQNIPDIPRAPHIRVVPVTSSYYSFAEQTVFLRSLLTARLDLMHFLHFNAPVAYRRPSVATIHDLTRFLFPAQKRRCALHRQAHQWVYEHVFRTTVRHASRIITVSHDARDDLIRFFPDTANRVSVIYEGVDATRFHPQDGGQDAAVLARFGITTPYLLFVGVWMGHKNIRRLLEAFRILKRTGVFPGTLVITGEGRQYDEPVRSYTNELGITDVVLLPGRVDDADLPCLYRRANAYVFPSLYEGFGFTPLEAMACGTPVVASRVASMPEVLGDAAHYVDPFSVDDIARGMRAVLGDTVLRTTLMERGKHQAARYHWDACARETLRVYRDTIRS